MRRFVHRPSPALLVALIALSVALSGTATARGVIAALRPNSVTSKTVKDGSLRIADFNRKDGSRLRGDRGLPGPAGPAGDVGPQGPPGAGGGYSKTEAEAAFLGKGAQAADSAKLGGTSASAFVQGGGTQSSGSVLMAAGDPDASLGSIPGIGTLAVGCSGGENMDLRVTNDQPGTVRASWSYVIEGSAPTIDGRQLTAGNNFDLPFLAGDSAGVLQLVSTTGAGALAQTTAATVTFTAVNDPASDPGKCRWQADVQTSRTNTPS